MHSIKVKRMKHKSINIQGCKTPKMLFFYTPITKILATSGCIFKIFQNFTIVISKIQKLLQVSCKLKNSFFIHHLSFDPLFSLLLAILGGGGLDSGLCCGLQFQLAVIGFCWLIFGSMLVVAIGGWLFVPLSMLVVYVNQC